jgi:hypothetical protein
MHHLYTANLVLFFFPMSIFTSDGMEVDYGDFLALKKNVIISQSVLWYRLLHVAGGEPSSGASECMSHVGAGVCGQI